MVQTKQLPQQQQNPLGRVMQPLTRQLLSQNAFLAAEMDILPGSTLPMEVDNEVLAWQAEIANGGIQTVTTPKLYSSLLRDSTWVGHLPDITSSRNISDSFSFYPSQLGSKYLAIKDERGKLLGFRFPISPENLSTLKETEHDFSKSKECGTEHPPRLQPGRKTSICQI
jgi:hypothetical protein